MKFKNVFLMLIVAPIVIISTIITLWLLYAYGPVPILRLTPYEIEQRRVAFPQWINNDEICYIELVLYRDKTIFEQGKFALFIKAPIMDVYIYREKVGHPETKKLIKHIARRNMQPNKSLEGSLDADMGFRVYDNGNKIFLYYNYFGFMPGDYRYITMDVTGRNMKERNTKIIPLDISQDGKKLYGISIERGPDKVEKDVSKDGKINIKIKMSNEKTYHIVEYSEKNQTIKDIAVVTEDKFKYSYRGRIKDLKLLSNDKLVLSYISDINKSPQFNFLYLINISDRTVEFIDELNGTYYSDTTPYYDRYSFQPNMGFTFAKHVSCLIVSNIGIYAKKDVNWIKIKPFYEEYPAISPDGNRLVFIHVLANKGELDSLWFAGRQLKIIDLADLITSKEAGQ